MSATNSTTYYEFPVFVGSDKPAWLVDWNGAMNAIDSAIHEAKAEADANATSITSLQSDVTSLAGSVSSQGSSITSLTQSLTSLQGTVNTITSLIGNGEPTTDDKTIIGAINELKADIDALDPSGQGVQAENVSYDNTDSGLTADDVQSAIDELKADIDNISPSVSVDADDVTYSNTASGLVATDVQTAIDTLCTPSATEKVVGKTASGDLIYEKVISADNQNITTTTTIDATITKNNSKVIGMNLVVKDSTGYKSAFDAYADNTLYQVTPRVTENGVLLVVSGSTIYEYYLTIRYVKVS